MNVGGLLLAMGLTLAPLVELKGGLPTALIYAQRNGVPSLLMLVLILSLNLLLIFALFFFFDKIHTYLWRFQFYRKIFSKYARSMRKKVKRFERKHEKLGFFALFLFVAVPLPLTGAYMGTFLSWFLNLERKKSVYAIALGISTAGIIIYLSYLGIFSMLS